LTVRDRVLAWVVTGPVGRLAAFVADLAVYWWQCARRRLAGTRGSGVDGPAAWVVAGQGHRRGDEEEVSMSNTDTLRDGYEAFGRGDLDGATQNFADDIRWENPEAPVIPNNGVTEGKEQVKQLFAELGNYWESFSITPDEFIESGETVVVLSHSEAKGKETGKEVKLPWVHVWRFEDGKVTEVQALTDTALVADALGRS
jgi:uncharacterized protein